jgi:hypothetical protein
VVSATGDLVAIMADCSARGANSDLLTRFGVNSLPTVLLLDPDGSQVGQLGARDPAGVVASVKGLIARYPAPEAAAPATPGRAAGTDPAMSTPDGRIRVSPATLDEGRERARALGRLLAVIYADPAKEERTRQVNRVLEALTMRGMDALPEQFTWIFRPSCDDQKASTPEAAVYQAKLDAPTVVLLDPWAEVPAGAALPALGRCEDLKLIRTVLQTARRDAARAHHPPPTRR